ncbi:MAG: hypothetical protein IH571_04370, partial [Acholeplasmataceae bacterium]|nr:hypothetical protein [Acholeplasmataceae bacterium]
LNMNNTLVLAESFSKIEIGEDGFTYVDFLCSAIDFDTHQYDYLALSLQKEVDGTLRIVKGSTQIEARTYISGFFFNLVDDHETESQTSV